jgi:heme-degrading monooxygenase HmoA
MAAMYAIIWRYQVKPEAIDAFTAAYGREGDWARLFKLDEGFLGTELYRGAEADDVFITIDRWLSRDHFTRFMQRLGDAYAALDERLEGLTLFEARLGDFETEVIEGHLTGLKLRAPK